MVLPYNDMIQPWVYMCSPSWPSLHLPPHPIPLDHPRAPALSTLSHALNLDWWSVSHMIIYLFHGYSHKSSHPLRIEPHTSQRCSEGWSISCVNQDPETPQRLRQNCVWESPEVVRVSSGLPQRQGLWVQQTWVWRKSSWRRLLLTHHRASKTYTGLGNRLLEDTNWTLCTPAPRRKDQWPHKRLTQTWPWASRSLWQMCGSAVACCRVGGTECSSVFMRPFEGGCHYLHYLHHSLPSGQITGREHSPTHQQKLGLKIYWA